MSTSTDKVQSGEKKSCHPSGMKGQIQHMLLMVVPMIAMFWFFSGSTSSESASGFYLWLLLPLLLCVGMHFFMMKGMMGHNQKNSHGTLPKPEKTDSDFQA